MSPTLFNRHTEDIFRDAKEKEGTRINGRNVNCLRYADDMALIATDMEALNRLPGIVNENGEKLGMRINAKKTKVMIIGKDIRDEDEPCRIMVSRHYQQK